MKARAQAFFKYEFTTGSNTCRACTDHFFGTF